jgi:hypothetical protein
MFNVDFSNEIFFLIVIQQLIKISIFLFANLMSINDMNYLDFVFCVYSCTLFLFSLQLTILAVNLARK